MAEHTERTVLNALRKRHAPKSGGNGPEWAYVEHVRSAAGFNAKRTLDAIGLGLWPSRGMELHGYEVKVSRADFRREINDPAKMDAFAHVLDRFWIVAPTGIVPRDELPATWGLLEVNAKGEVRQKVAAPLLSQERVAIPRTFLVPLMRAAGAGLDYTPDEKAIQEAEARGYEHGRKSAGRSGEQWEGMYHDSQERLKEHRETVLQIDRALGLSTAGHAYSAEDRAKRLTKVADAVRSAVNGDDQAERARAAVRRALHDVEDAKKSLARTSEWIAKEAGITLEGQS